MEKRNKQYPSLFYHPVPKCQSYHWSINEQTKHTKALSYVSGDTVSLTIFDFVNLPPQLFGRFIPDPAAHTVHVWCSMGSHAASLASSRITFWKSSVPWKFEFHLVPEELFNYLLPHKNLAKVLMCCIHWWLLTSQNSEICSPSFNRGWSIGACQS